MTSASEPLATSGSPGTEIDRLRALVARWFPVYETRVTPNSLLLLVHADRASLEERFDSLRQELWPMFYVPQVRYEGGEYVVEIVRRPTRRSFGPWANLILLGLTIGSTVAAGAFLWLSYVGGSHLVAADFVWGGVYFALPLMGILGVHELAHFVMARRHHVEASLPYFLPVPPPYLLFGTFGAFISLRQPIPDKKALLDIGASGPIAGFAMAVPITVLGMFLSAHAPNLSVANCGPTILGQNYGNLLIGVPPIWSALGAFVPINFTNLHPVALAGWVGLLVTAINLIPAGQLDGGHVFRALLGERSRYLSYAAVAALIGLGFLYPGWFIFAVLIFFLGMRHPPPLNDISPLDGKRVAVGALAAALLVGGFVVIPISMPTGDFALQNQSASAIPLPPGAAMADNVSVQVVDQDVVAHAFLASGTITKVIGVVNGTSQPLSGAALLAFEANSTWTIVLPSGNRTILHGVGNWSIPASQYLSVSAGGRAELVVEYENSAQASVDLTLTIRELCASGSPSPQTASFTIH